MGRGVHLIQWQLNHGMKRSGQCLAVELGDAAGGGRKPLNTTMLCPARLRCNPSPALPFGSRDALGGLHPRVLSQGQQLLGDGPLLVGRLGQHQHVGLEDLQGQAGEEEKAW